MCQYLNTLYWPISNIGIKNAQKDLVEPRIPNMRGIMAARTKPLEVLEPETLSNFTAHASYELPAPKAAVKMIDASNAGELIRLLREEAKII